MIEAKSPRRKLDSHVRRLQQYLEMLQTTYGLLTNGKELRIYRYQDSIMALIFKCNGQDIKHHIDTIKNIIGREALHVKLGRQIPTDEEIESQTVEYCSEQTEERQPPLADTPESQVIRPENDLTAYVSIQHDNLNQLGRSHHTMKIIAIYHNKGGVGKTTVSIRVVPQ